MHKHNSFLLKLLLRVIGEATLLQVFLEFTVFRDAVQVLPVHFSDLEPALEVLSMTRTLAVALLFKGRCSADFVR